MDRMASGVLILYFRPLVRFGTQGNKRGALNSWTGALAPRADGWSFTGPDQ